MSTLEEICEWAESFVASKPADFTIGTASEPKLQRWYVVPRNEHANVYLHVFYKSDPDVPHDHPWDNSTLILRGNYLELRLDNEHREHYSERHAGDRVERYAYEPHRILLSPGQSPVLTLFITGPVYRQWGFHCPRGWVSAERFLRMRSNGNETGLGCGEL